MVSKVIAFCQVVAWEYLTTMERIDREGLYDLRFKWKSGCDGVWHVLRFCMSMSVPSVKRITQRKDVSDMYEWLRRNKKSPAHYIRRSVRSGSWFSQSLVNVVDVLLMTEFFVRSRKQEDASYELRLGRE